MPDTYPLGDDQTSKLLQDSRMLRVQLQTLSNFEPVYLASEAQAQAIAEAQAQMEARAAGLYPPSSLGDGDDDAPISW